MTYAEVEQDTDFLDSTLFTEWTDPVSGIRSYILAPGDQRCAPIQQSFYYVNPSLSADFRYYWFYCAFPPANSAHQGRCLGLADFEKGTVTYLPNTAFSEASPMVIPDDGSVYWANESGIWSRTIECNKPRLVNSFPPKLTRNRKVNRYATHLTISADGTALGIDAQIGNEHLVGRAPINGDEIEIWQSLPRLYNHGQFHPTNPDLLLLAQENGVDSATGEARQKENRLWLVEREKGMYPVYPSVLQDRDKYRAVSSNSHLESPVDQLCTDPRQMHGHEWWSADGGHIWYIHYQTGVERIPLSFAGSERAVPELIWPHDTVSHAHTDSTSKGLVLDAHPPNFLEGHHVRFVNLESERSVDIVSKLPTLSSDYRRYHVHAHPQFCGGDSLICYTTTVLGNVDVAFTRVADLKSAT